MAFTLYSSSLPETIERARKHSSFLSLLLNREPQLAEDLADAFKDPLAAACDFAGDMNEAARLRIERRRLALIVALGDLSGQFDLTRVTQTLSDFADDALGRAIRTAILERTPDAEPLGFAAIALGKQGSRERSPASRRMKLPCGWELQNVRNWRQRSTFHILMF